MSKALDIIQDETLTYHQELIALAQLGESTDDTLVYSDAYYEGKAKGALCDLNEGRMPYRPRYICPDYELLFRKGCEFLELDPPADLLEAVNVLEIFYNHVPSITTFPVYLGSLDSLDVVSSFFLNIGWGALAAALIMIVTAVAGIFAMTMMEGNSGSGTAGRGGNGRQSAVSGTTRGNAVNNLYRR